LQANRRASWRLTGIRSAIAARGGYGPVVGDLSQDPIESCGVVRANFNHRRAGVAPRLADLDLLETKRPPMGTDRVEDFRQDQAVDDVTPDLDFFPVDTHFVPLAA